jgi:hypothetical protein
MAGMAEPEKETAPGGFTEEAITGLRNASKFLPFPMGGGDAPDSADMAARFILLMNNSRVSCPDNPYTEIRDLLRFFFKGETRFPPKKRAAEGNILECSLLLGHLTNTAMYHLHERTYLPFRTVLKDLLRRIAEDGRSFDAAKLADYLTYHWDSFSLFDEGFEHHWKLKTDTLTLGGMVYESKDGSGFYMAKNFRKDFLVKPLFKGYCYLLASLGVLAITQKEPDRVLTKRGKTYPLSPYDSLGSVRVTDFGRWCLDLMDALPGLPDQKYEVTADKELLLVAVRGNSLERKTYLDLIGRQFGKDGWRISAGSFIAGCASKQAIEERIASFRRLVDANPSPHWEALFHKVCSRAGLFDGTRNDIRVYSLPKDQALREELLSDPLLKTIALRGEGNMLMVPVPKLAAFSAFLGEHGIAVFS